MDANVRRELDKLRALGGGGGGTPSDTNPLDLGTAAPGVGTDYSRFDHVHAHGAQLGGALHAAATNAAAGFATAAQITTLEGLDDLSDCLSVFASNGVDDTAAVNSRIADAVAVGKRRIHFGDGTWVFDCGALTDDSCLIEVPSNFIVTGAGWGRSILSIVNTSTIGGAGGVSVFRSEFDARSVRFGPGLDFVGANGTDPDGADQSYVLNNENCCIDTWPGSIDSRDVTITGCMFRQTYGFGIHDRGGNFRTTVTGCHFLQCNGGANTNSDYGLVSHCHFERSEGVEASGKYSLFLGSTFKDCFGVALSIGGAVGGTEQPGCAVIGNTVDGCTGVGIVNSDGFSHSVVSGNVVRKCTLGGMVMYSSGATVVRENVISFNIFDSNCASPSLGVIIGFDCRGNSGGHNIFGNQFIDSGEAGFSQSYGMSLDAANCIVAGNRFDGAGLHDASFGANATNTYLGDNYFVNSTQEFLAGSSIAIRKQWGLASSDLVMEQRVWNATMGAGRALHSRDLAGKMFWGDGTNLQDTTLYRSAADTLKTDDAFVAVGTITGSNLSGTNTGDEVNADATHAGRVTLGAQTLGSGTKTADALVASVDVTGNSTTSAQNGQFHAKNSNANAFAAFRCYDSAAGAQFSFGYANSGTGSPFTSAAYISTASGTATRFLTASIVSAEISTGRIWDFTNNPTVGSVAVLNQTNTVASISNKSLTSPTIASGAISGTFTGNATLSGNLTQSGSNTYSGLSTRSSGLKASTRSTTATTVTMGNADEVILASANSGAVTLNLQAAATVGAGRKLTVVKTDAGGNAVTLDGNASETINGAVTRALAAQYDKVEIVSDGTNWFEV